VFDKFKKYSYVLLVLLPVEMFFALKNLLQYIEFIRTEHMQYVIQNSKTFENMLLYIFLCFAVLPYLYYIFTKNYIFLQKKYIIYAIYYATVLTFSTYILSLIAKFTYIDASDLFQKIIFFAYLILFAIIFFIVIPLIFSRRQKQYEISRKGTFGTAKLEDPLKFSKDERGAIIAGIYNNRKIFIPAKNAFEHTILVGAPGAGKSSSIYIPNILKQAKDGVNNLVITDVLKNQKGEIFTATADELSKNGYKIRIFCPSMPKISDTWNIIKKVQTYSDADRIAETIIAATGVGKETFWADNSRQLITLAILYVRNKVKGGSLNHVKTIFSALSFDQIYNMMKNSEIQSIKNNFAILENLKNDQKLAANVLSDIPRRLQVFNNEEIQAITDNSTINFDELKNEKNAWFIQIDMSKKDQMMLIFNLFYRELFNFIQSTTIHPTLFFLDEFANLGKIPNFAGFQTLARGQNAGLVIGLQSINQLEKNYEKAEAQTIIDAVRTRIFFPNIGFETAKYVSEEIGKTTIKTISATDRNTSALFSSSSTSESESARNLINPDEITSLNSEKIIILQRGERPILIDQYRYFKYENIKYADINQFANRYIRVERDYLKEINATFITQEVENKYVDDIDKFLN